ncbi:hypothetical protein [Ferruginibacter sp.]|nr:hypothetical protein [Ferruginibacter sp.]
MPHSKNRHPHKHVHQHDNPQAAPGTHPKHKKTNQSIIVASIFFALIGLGISFFIAGTNIIGLIAGAVIGAIAGYIFGLQVNKSLAKK